MKKRLTTLLFLLVTTLLSAQYDLSVIAITSPVSACSMSSTENVTIRIFNYGASLPAGSSFNVLYSINASPPVFELVVLGSTLLSNSTLQYTFTTQANLSTPGSYTFDASVMIAGDMNPSNNTFTGYVVANTPASVGGTVSGGTNVCEQGNSGNLTLSGHTGSVQRWERSTDGGNSWNNIANNTTNQAYLNLTQPTLYRALVQSGTCATAYSSEAAMTIDPQSLGGTLGGTATVCSGSNSGTMTLTGRTGNIIRWERSIDGGDNWINITNTTASQSYSNLTTTTRYKVLVQSGSCPSVYSSASIITVSPHTVGGSLSPDTSVCPGSNSGSLSLSGHTGNVVRWEYSTDGGMSWNNISNTTTTQSYTNLTQERIYRARIQSSPCAVAYSSPATISMNSGAIPSISSHPEDVNVAPQGSAVFSVTPEAGSFTYQWQVDEGGGFTDLSEGSPYSGVQSTELTVSPVEPFMDQYAYRCVVTSDCPASIESESAVLNVLEPAQLLGFPYQAVARDAAGHLLAEQNISLRMSIHEGSAAGPVEYSETHSATTNKLGLFTLTIGSGNPVSGSFLDVNWSTAAKFLQVELDATGVSSYTDMGSSQLLSVPYALYAGNVQNVNTPGRTANRKASQASETKKNSSAAIAFAASLSGDQSVNPNQSQGLVFDRVEYNQGKAYNAGSGVFTAPKAGIYHFDASVLWPAFAEHAQLALHIEVNGNARRSSYMQSGAVGLSQSLSCELGLQTGDQVRISLQQDGKESQSISGASGCSLSGRLLD